MLFSSRMFSSAIAKKPPWFATAAGWGYTKNWAGLL